MSVTKNAPRDLARRFAEKRSVHTNGWRRETFSLERLEARA
jgi:hypothetical protein